MAAVQLSAPSETEEADNEPPQRPFLQTAATSPDQDQTGIFSFSTSPSAVRSPTSPDPLPRQFPTADVEVHDTIPEASDEESDCDSPIEPVTPVSGRLSPEDFAPAAPETASTTTASTAVASSVSVPIAAKALPIAIPAASAHNAHHGHHKHHHAGNHHTHHSHTRQSSHQDNSLNCGANGNADLAKGAKAASLAPSDEHAGRPTTAVNGSFLIESPTAVPSSAANTETASTQSFRPSRTSSSASGFKRTMSNLFRRSNSQNDRIAFTPPDFSAATAASDLNLADMNTNTAANARKTPNRRWSMHRALASPSNVSHSPPSPGSPPLEMAIGHKHGGAAPATSARNGGPKAPARAGSGDSAGRLATSAASARNGVPSSLPTQDDFLQNERKKFRQRAATGGMSFQNALHMVTGSSAANGSRMRNRERRTDYIRRASSVDHGHCNNNPLQYGGEPWGIPAEAGTGLKARRMSLSLPDDFTVDVIDLHSEFEYSHLLGRHRRHLGKGTTSKVTLMHRKGFADEVVAVKEFRPKNKTETTEEYEKKVKSEYSIAKSLHHPNIVETLCLCTDHGRWNHVMEFCQEGDLYGLVSKKYLRAEDREKDRLCLFKQMIQGLNYLHSHGIAHRDIKLENLLITTDSKLKITDFGASDIFAGVHPGLRDAGGRCGINMDGSIRLCKPGICGSLPYISPEVLDAKEPYDPRKLDVWAAAVVMLNLIFGAPLWDEARVRSGQTTQYTVLVAGWERHRKRYPHCKGLDAEVERKVDSPQETLADAALTPDGRPIVPAAALGDDQALALDGPYPKMEAFDVFVNPPVLRRILLHMLNPDAAERVTIDQVANLRWIRNIECCQPEAYEDPFAPPKPQTIDASKGGYIGRPGQKIFCHNHLPSKMHSHAIGRIG